MKHFRRAAWTEGQFFHILHSRGKVEPLSKQHDIMYEVEVKLNALLTPALDGDEWSASLPRGKVCIQIGQGVV
jgi:hypothetical protein